MKAGIDKINHPEILTCGRSVRQGVSGEAAPYGWKLTQLFSSPPPPPRKGMLLPTPRKPLPPNPQGSVRPRRRPGAEEKTAKDSGLKRTHSTALGEESKSAASQKELKKRANKREGGKKKSSSGRSAAQLP